MMQQSALARGADAGDFLQPGLPDIAAAADAVRADGEAMRLVAQPLHEIEHGIAGLELERLPPRNKERLQPGVTVGSLVDRQKRYVGAAARGPRLLRRSELTPRDVDDDEAGPRRIVRAVGAVRTIIGIR